MIVKTRIKQYQRKQCDNKTLREGGQGDDTFLHTYSPTQITTHLLMSEPGDTPLQ